MFITFYTSAILSPLCLVRSIQYIHFYTIYLRTILILSPIYTCFFQVVSSCFLTKTLYAPLLTHTNRPHAPLISFSRYDKIDETLPERSFCRLGDYMHDGVEFRIPFSDMGGSFDVLVSVLFSEPCKLQWILHTTPG